MNADLEKRRRQADKKVEQLQEESEDLYNEAQDLYKVYGLDYKRAQELELKSARLSPPPPGANSTTRPPS
jgi:hypothetical protein